MSFRNIFKCVQGSNNPQDLNDRVSKLEKERVTMNTEFDQLKQDVTDLKTTAATTLGAIAADVDRMAKAQTSPAPAELTALSTSIRSVIAAMTATETSVDATAAQVAPVAEPTPTPDPTQAA